ncbi:hypothetical protein I317_07110 [Kwoniella heveanensis CBS 569]|uniref:Uncharacterized protein n=1 Tax=Kwoniella heveanensis BCC8398 TaxID=1296120 RepID=A0A1B9GMT3_9TREE|nr:hypothetical protein I316_06079 [Kwoniella heveanensis BCC8398]OCF39086.1 hypothetical protein I317_07110 [Kwoniella heveanensis CBS 569]
MSAAAIAASQMPSNSNGKADKDAAKGVKRKGSASRGVEALKKVNTNSMAKLTSFFKPKGSGDKDKDKDEDKPKPATQKKKK